MKIFNTIAILSISFSALCTQATALQAQTPSATNPAHKKAPASAKRFKSGKTTAPASTANASTPAATGSGPSSSDIHTKTPNASVKQPPSIKAAAAPASGGPAPSAAKIPNTDGSTGGKQSRTIKTVPPPAATGSGPSSSDIHTTAKPAIIPPAKAKTDKKKHKTGNR